MNRFLLAPVLVCATLIFAPAAFAQEGCQTVQRSCSQMNQRCEQNCQSSNNASACVARFCSVHLTACKANGVWKPQGGAACWKTNNRS